MEASLLAARPFGTKHTNLEDCLHAYLVWYQANESRVVDFASAVQFLRLACNGRVYIIHMLRDRIVSLRAQYANLTDLDAALDTYTQRYATTVDTISDPVKLVEFLKTSTDDTLRLLHMLTVELKNAEGKAARDSLLALPLIYR